MTKAEFHLDIAGLYDNKDITESIAIEAMKQHAIEFAEWMISEGWQVHLKKDKWYKHPHHLGDDHFTTEQLYDKFNNQEP